MACRSCGGGVSSASIEYKVTTNKGNVYTVASIPEVRVKLALEGGGQYKAVPKSK